ncbi:substrate-binding protein [Halosegnis rubeus]|jgi:ABC-type branched-subunit amino acid transport system substrate-binding protein|uniref:substrate-binding protein n=1 Tax=Halosegnis rubeus TaxID=2212850 RepID=UPI0018D85D16|nr:substrate-binding protein [Halosegnis rubeus]
MGVSIVMNDTNHTRRTVMKAAGAAGIAGLAGCSSLTSSSGESIGNYPIEGDTATFGFNIPRSGPYASEGEDELRAYELAVKHLNNGGGWVDSQFDGLSGDGVADKTIDYEVMDTGTDKTRARENAKQLIERENAIMVTGGSSSSVAINVQAECQAQNVIFMACLTHSNATTGADCARYGFREMFNAYHTAEALAPVLQEEYGSDNTFYQLYADYTWGESVQASMRRTLTETAGWTEADSVATPLGEDDYSSFLSEAANSGADVLLLDHYGLDGATSVQQAVDAGLNEEMEIVLPLYNRPMASAAGDAISGVFGTVAWDSAIDNTPSNEFTQTFESEYDRTPSGVAQLAYAQTLNYAAAVERAGSFNPIDVIGELEDYDYNNIGMGEETMRGCDHQAQRAVPVVRGLPADEISTGNYFDIVNLTDRSQVSYGCDSGPAAECTLGPAEPQ